MSIVFKIAWENRLKGDNFSFYTLYDYRDQMNNTYMAQTYYTNLQNYKGDVVANSIDLA